MKKVFAVLLAVLMLLGTAALAEQGAAVMIVDHVQLDSMGEKVDVQDMSASLVLQNINDLPSVALLIDGAGQPLFSAVGQLTANQFMLAIDGVEKGFTKDIPAKQAAQMAQLGSEEMATLVPALLPMLDKLSLPPLSAVTIPKLDLSTALAPYMTGNGAYEIPVEQSIQLLEKVLDFAKSQAKSVSQLNKVIGMLEDLQKDGTGIAIRGTISDNGRTQKVVAGIHMAHNGKVDKGQTARLTLESRENDTTLDVAAVKFGIPFSLASVTMNANPTASRVEFDISVIGGMGVRVRAYNEAGLNKVTFSGNAGSQSGSFEFAYGQQDGNDILSFTGTAGIVETAFVLTTAMGADGVRTGDAVIKVYDGVSSISLSGKLTLYTGAPVDMSGFAMPGQLVDFGEMQQSDNDAIAAAFKPVTDYINSHLATQAG